MKRIGDDGAVGQRNRSAHVAADLRDEKRVGGDDACIPAGNAGDLARVRGGGGANRDFGPSQYV